MERPAVDRVDGLSPTWHRPKDRQSSPQHVGTVAVLDHLRLWMARLGTCPVS